MLILAILLATLWVVGAAVGAWVEGSLKRQFTATGNVFRALMAERAERLIGETSLLAGDFALKRAIATYDPDTLSSVAVNHRERIGADLLWITDENGRLLAAAGGHVDPNAQLTALAPLSQAMSSDAPAVAVTEVDTGLVQLVAVPIFGPDPIGYLLAGEAIDDATARQLQANTGPAVSFLTAERLFATSWPPAERSQLFPSDAIWSPVLERHLARAQTTTGAERSTFLLDLQGDRLLSTLIPIEEAQLPAPLYALVQDSYDRALGPLAVLRRWVAAIGVAALIGALAVGGMIAGGIAAPVQLLVAAMRRVLQRLSRTPDAAPRGRIGFSPARSTRWSPGCERERIKETFGRSSRATSPPPC